MKTYYNGYSLSNTRFNEKDIEIQTTPTDWSELNSISYGEMEEIKDKIQDILRKNEMGDKLSVTDCILATYKYFN